MRRVSGIPAAFVSALLLAACQNGPEPPIRPQGAWPSRPAAGSYRMIVHAADECRLRLPPEAVERTYQVTLPGESARLGPIPMGGATMYRQYDAMYAAITPSSTTFFLLSWSAFEQWLDDAPVFERVGDTGYIALSGVSSGRWSSGPDRSYSSAFSGAVSYCPAATERLPFGPTCDVPATTCESPNHSVTVEPAQVPSAAD